MLVVLLACAEAKQSAATCQYRFLTPFINFSPPQPRTVYRFVIGSLRLSAPAMIGPDRTLSTSSTEAATMADAERTCCPRCGGSLPSGDPPGPCPHCGIIETPREQTKMPPVSLSFPGAVSPKAMLAFVGAAIVATLFGGLWLAGRRERQRADLLARVARGAELYRLGKLDEAIAVDREAIEIKPDLAEAHNNLGIALGVKGRPAEAVAEFRTAIRLRPDDADAHNNLKRRLAIPGCTSRRSLPAETPSGSNPISPRPT